MRCSGAIHGTSMVFLPGPGAPAGAAVDPLAGARSAFDSSPEGSEPNSARRPRLAPAGAPDGATYDGRRNSFAAGRYQRAGAGGSGGGPPADAPVFVPAPAPVPAAAPALPRAAEPSLPSGYGSPKLVQQLSAMVSTLEQQNIALQEREATAQDDARRALSAERKVEEEERALRATVDEQKQACGARVTATARRVTRDLPARAPRRSCASCGAMCSRWRPRS